jgi:hypothetical protein
MSPLAFLIVLAFVSCCTYDRSAEIDRLIQQLGSPRFADREAAGKRLQAIGEPAFEALRKAASASADPEIRQRAARLAPFVSNLKDVAGQYFLGNGVMRFTLYVRDEGRFDFAWTGCPGFNEQCSGAARFVNGWLILTPDRRNVPKGDAATPTEFLPVTWGQRRYLVARDELLDFCNEINQGAEPRNHPDGSFCLLGGRWTVSVSGRPKLPNEWQAYLLANPLHGKVVEMVNPRIGKLNLGEKDGVRKGMVLTIGGGSLEANGVRVVSVEKNSCLIREENELIVPVIKTGQPVSSRVGPREQPRPKEYPDR